MTSWSHGTGRHKWIKPLWRETASISRKLWRRIHILPLIPEDSGCVITRGDLKENKAGCHHRTNMIYCVVICVNNQALPACFSWLDIHNKNSKTLWNMVSVFRSGVINVLGYFKYYYCYHWLKAPPGDDAQWYIWNIPQWCMLMCTLAKSLKAPDGSSQGDFWICCAADGARCARTLLAVHVRDVTVIL